jgi:hypothetical protein
MARFELQFRVGQTKARRCRAGSAIKAISCVSPGITRLSISSSTSTTVLQMSPDLLCRIGAALYGEHWHSSLAHDLGVPRRTVQHWAAGNARPPATLRRALARLVGTGGFAAITSYLPNKRPPLRAAKNKQASVGERPACSTIRYWGIPLVSFANLLIKVNELTQPGFRQRIGACRKLLALTAHRAWRPT